MAEHTTDEPLVDVEEVYSKTEKYLDENRKSLAIILGAILVMVGGYFAWAKLYVEPQDKKAQNEMFMAERYFERDSIDKAINGDGQYDGFKTIVEKYGVTKSGNLAHYYLGICYLKKGEYQKAIDQLKEFDGDDHIVGSIAIGGIGDANMELGKVDEAIENYLKAAKHDDNKFTAPIYLMKAGLAYEEKSDFKNAVKVYEQIKTDFPESTEGRDIEKYLARARTQAGI
jgi:tetratricopeptide (TPR) repeat protein